MSFVNQLNGVAKDENAVPEPESDANKPTTSSPKSDKSEKTPIKPPTVIKVKHETSSVSIVESSPVNGGGAMTTDAVPDDDSEMPSNEGTGASPTAKDKKH